jgi:ribosomal protein S18 acetylase RimI-like enzyme
MELTRHIREATPEDSDGLRKCMESAYAMYRARMGGVRLPPMDVDYSAEIKQYPTWVVVSEGCIIGGLIMVFENDHASIANIAVNPKFQGQGIGGELFRFAESKGRENNCPELRLTTHVLLEENIRLYRHLGWKEMSRDESKVFMKKEI